MVELLVTVLLVVGAVAASWSSYQATRWNGEQAKAAGRTSAIRIGAARAAGLASAQTQVDVATFIAWTEAEGRGDTELEAFYVDRFRPEFKTAFDAWLATDPLVDDTAPKTPFAMADYRVAEREEATRLDAEAEASSARVATNIQRSSNYVLSVVLYTIVLLFAGMAGKMSSRRLRLGVVVAAYAVLVAALAWVSTFPVSLAV
ncbi:MAG TPA: hypothetical protein VFV89_00630 [Nocardioides sp.]|uniref:hypothetical protein n=1 Tax=Nocardioides sp. TaxID=35761 RepID=UPI002E353EC1|nr:hypothetical protein [Nocardioides sp.]HEX5086283.1 hypothetical protein [Nocardioides sp.]